MSLLILLADSAAGSAAALLFQYIDPGAGSLLLQLLLGGIAGVAVIAKLYWKKLQGWFGRSDTRSQSDSKS
jgi:hypothetical protein